MNPCWFIRPGKPALDALPRAPLTETWLHLDFVECDPLLAFAAVWGYQGVNVAEASSDLEDLDCDLHGLVLDLTHLALQILKGFKLFFRVDGGCWFWHMYTSLVCLIDCTGIAGN
ncbi:MAG: hypothetical protein EBT80_00655 [Chitinophagales bacterium]|nr:hypothetical protein [Chitinophagales bacterium]